MHHVDREEDEGRALQEAVKGHYEELFEINVFVVHNIFVKNGVLRNLIVGDVFVVNLSENVEVGEEGGVEHHGVPVVKHNGDVVEDVGEEELDGGDEQAPVVAEQDYLLGAVVKLSPVPQNYVSDVFELFD